MKQCPVCNAVCFDDMGTCYGCLHVFRKNEEPERVSSSAIECAQDVQSAASTPCAGVQMPEEQDVCEVDDGDFGQKRSMRQPAHAQSGLERVPKVIVEHVDKRNETMSTTLETWSIKLTIPADCQGVTLRLERD